MSLSFKIFFPLILVFSWLTPSYYQNSDNNCLKGKGPTIEQNQDIKPFDELILNMNAKVKISQGQKPSLKVDAQRKLHKHLKTSVLNRKLKIRLDTAVCSHKKITVIITAPSIEKIVNNGMGQITTNSTLAQNNIQLVLNGSGFINGRIRVQQLHTKIHGSGTIELSGKAKNHQIESLGSGKLKAFYLTANNAEITTHGKSTLQVYVLENLNASVNGNGLVEYKGTPEVNSSIFGTGQIIPVN